MGRGRSESNRRFDSLQRMETRDEDFEGRLRAPAGWREGNLIPTLTKGGNTFTTRIYGKQITWRECSQFQLPRRALPNRAPGQGAL